MKSFATHVSLALSLLVSAGAGNALAQAGHDLAGVIAAHEGAFPADMWNPTEAWGDASRLPDVPERYQRNFERAWLMAGEGSAPTTICGGFFNGAGVMLANADHPADDLQDAMQALDACYTGVMARYLSVRLDAAAGPDQGCMAEMTATNNHRQVATSLLRDVDPDGQIVTYLDGRLHAALGDRVGAACPDFVASIILVPAP